jgi:hypothetical protein
MAHTNHAFWRMPLAGLRANAACFGHVQHALCCASFGMTGRIGRAFVSIVSILALVTIEAQRDRVPISGGSPPCVSG